MPKIDTIQDVAENHLCCGCGICAFLCPDHIKMVDDIKTGRRPILSPGTDNTLFNELAEEMLNICPGIELKYKNIKGKTGYIDELITEWGPIIEIYEGYADDTEFRYRGSSGGVASTLALFGIEHFGMHGVLHIASRDDIPYLNHTVLSRSRDEIVSRMGSRYSPASPCDGLQKIVDAPAPCIVIGKPCDIAAIEKARKIRPELNDKIGLTVSLFCAATPSTAGTFAMMKHWGIIDKKSVRSICYRGNGWPGNSQVEFFYNDVLHTKQMTYADSWNKILCHYRQWRCNLCVDHTGEFADISVGDPWYRNAEANDPGRSLILVRSQKGHDFLKQTDKKSYLKLEKAAPSVLPDSQPSLLNIRRTVWGRLFALKLAGVATPRIHGIPLFKFWVTHLPIRQKLRSIIGTFKRIARYKLKIQRKVIPFSESQISRIKNKGTK